MDLPGKPGTPGPRPGERPRRGRSAVAALRFRLSVLVVFVGGCGGPHPASNADPQTTTALVDSCRGVGDGALCNDQNTCTVGDRCVSGLCVGTLAPDGTSCTDNNQCTATDVCLQGVCKGSPVDEGTLCTDGDPCTDPDVCHLGRCTSGGPATCDDGDQCTMDRCVEGDGCRHDRILSCSDAAMTGDGAAADADAGATGDAAGGDAEPSDAQEDTGSSDATDGPLDVSAPDLPAGDGAADDAVADGSDATDALADDGPAADADAGPDGGGDGDGGADGGTVDIARVYEAKGGACVCSSAPGGPRWEGVLIVVLALALLRARRRRLRPDR